MIRICPKIPIKLNSSGLDGFGLDRFGLITVRDGICVDPPLCRGTSQGKCGSRTIDLVCVGEIGEVGERELVLVVSCQVRQGTRHDTWMTTVLGHNDVQS